MQASNRLTQSGITPRTTCMPSYSKGDVVLVRYPFSDLSAAKVRPAVAVSAPHVSHDIFVVPLTSKTDFLLAGEFILNDWKGAGLNVVSAAKRGLFTIQQALIIRAVGSISLQDSNELELVAIMARPKMKTESSNIVRERRNI